MAIAKVEHRQVDDLLGLGEAAPRLSWVTETGVAGWRQAAYEIEVDGQSTGRVASAESVLVGWPGEPLRAREQRTVRVRVWGEGGEDVEGSEPSSWSAPVTIEAGLLSPGDWTARFVSPHGDGAADTIPPSPYLRRDFTVDGPPARARLYASALGVYQVEINGVRVGDHVLAPGWTSYAHRLRYETFDVTGLLRPGPNAIGAVLGEGWYRGTLGWAGGRRSVYGDRLALLAQLEIVAADGSAQTVVTDDRWRAGTGPIVASGIYAGETYDARLEQPGWSSPGFDDGDDGAGGWTGVDVVERDLATLTARQGPPVRRTGELRPVAITTSPSGRTVVDFGQNLVGRLRLRVPEGPAGATITVRHAEILQDGELCTEPLRRAEATDRYTLGAAGLDGATWEPRFTFHGFRYAEVDGWPGGDPPAAEDVTALVCHSDMARTGWFTCSDERLERLHENVVWGMRGNFLDVPTDCPQRDERLGWTGDIEVFAPTACFLYDAAGFLASWLGDLAADQRDDGAVPFVVPNPLRFVTPAAAWGDAATIVPWVVHERTGDRDLLRTQYPSMRAWVDHVVAAAGESRLWDDGFQFGDWLDPHAPAGNPFDGRTDVHLVANAYLCRSLDIVAETAVLLGEDGDAARYRQLAGEVRAAFAREYVTPSGRIASDSQTAYALALEFALYDDDEDGAAAQRDRAGRRLAELVAKAGHTIATGFVGTPILCDALCATGHADDAFKLLLQTRCPSWLYPVTMGATTIWERWDGIQPDGRLDPDAMRMNSFNHYALGAVADWLHRSVGGLAPAAPGYRRLRIAPLVSRVSRAPTRASALHLTPYGPAESSWRLDGTTFELTAVVPPNTTATVVLPGDEDTPIEVASGTHTWRYDLPSPSTEPAEPADHADPAGPGEGAAASGGASR